MIRQLTATMRASSSVATACKLSIRPSHPNPIIARLFTTTPSRPFTASPPTKESPFRLSANKANSPPSFDDAYYSLYPPKRQWPPDMSKLSPKHQFRLERKYRRRAALKYARPKFIKAVTIAQWAVIGFVIIYAVLFMEWETNDTPFHGIRDSFFAGLKSIFSSPPPSGLKRDQKVNTTGESSQ
ncbi:uncharacterized protein N7529_004100 [Penicillium soppii]|uniref:uncharacterized protein n=1 Tax=Penicillium soppii TaxID=69789 RepID=UPI002546EDF1|nr:uncharacterized protein N7529_004100 [Penicillium soppii]KAJ5871747.1 hypothetical protein N7529_004100 [Penicillium soppii]